jgi:DeoR family transcriptional regulator, fructose operon transcriptional repressor
MRPAERQLKIQDLFSREEFVNLAELCEKFRASKSSIRRDLIEMEERGVLRRVHGGAIFVQPRDESLDYGRLAVSHHEEKVRIGHVAAQLIEDGQTVIMGGGSTVVEVARSLNDRTVQIITNSIPVAQLFWESKQTEVILTGGYLYPKLGIQLGPFCERMLNSVSADVLVMGIRGITRAGLSDSNTLVVESIHAMIKAARKVVIVADHTKFGRDAMMHVADLNELDQVITDAAVPPEFRQMLAENNVECLLA